MTGLNKMFDEFHSTYGIEKKPLTHKLDSMLSLIKDEVFELEEEIYDDDFNFVLENPNKGNIVKEALDTVYIAIQQLRERGVDVDKGLAELHRSNMSKKIDIYDGESAIKELEIARERYPEAQLIPHSDKYVLKDAATGKVIKPTCYSEANMTKGIIGSK